EDKIRGKKPVVYQEKDGTRREIAASYAITAANRVTFELAKYDASRPLYIDPLIYSTYLGGSWYDSGSAIAVDSAGNAYVTGVTNSTDFPTMNPLQPANGGGYDAFVAKINPAGSALVYSTYLGGSGDDWGNGIAVDGAGNAYVVGQTASTDFPTVNPLQPANGGGAYGIAVDSAANAYVVGQTASTDFPTVNPLQPIYGGGGDDAFVTKLNPTGSALVYSTYLGGSNGDGAYGIAVDSAANAYVTGITYSSDFPTKNPLQGFESIEDVFVTKLNPAGSALVYSTYLGGSDSDLGNGIAVDNAGNAYVTGHTASTNFPTTPGAFQTTFGGNVDAFVTKLNPAGSAMVYSTYLGGSDYDSGSGIAVDSAGNAYVVGVTASTDFPTMNPFQRFNDGYGDAFVAKIDMGAATTITLSSSPNPSTYGQTVTFTAAVTSGLGAPPDGETVTFKKDTRILGTGTLSGGSA